MKSSIGIYDINEYLNYKTRLNIYRQAGFCELALYIDQSYMKEGENYLDIIAYARGIGLVIKQIHIDYKISNLICDEKDNTYFDYLESKLKECQTLHIPLLVLHASKGDNPPVLSSLQLEKLENLAKKYPAVTLCFENVRNNTNLDFILNSKLPNIKMCFDLGHAHAYDNEKDLFNKYKDKIACTHLHNNFGTDTHNKLDCGEIDYKYFLNQLSKTNSQSNCLECFPERNSIKTQQEFKAFIEECWDSLKIVKNFVKTVDKDNLLW